MRTQSGIYFIIWQKVVLSFFFFFLQPFSQPLNVLDHLEKLQNAVGGCDLSLRRFSYISYSQKLPESVKCSFSECNFKAKSGPEMITHQTEVQHPGWGRFAGTVGGKLWQCQLPFCQKGFVCWDGLYKHLQSHSKPLQCPSCTWRTDRQTRLRQHMTKQHGEDDGVSDMGRWTQKAGSVVLAKQV